MQFGDDEVITEESESAGTDEEVLPETALPQSFEIVHLDATVGPIGFRLP